MNPDQQPPTTPPLTPVDGSSSAEADQAALEAIQALESEEAALDEPIQELPQEEPVASTQVTPIVVIEPQPTPDPIAAAPQPIQQPEQQQSAEQPAPVAEPVPVAVKAPVADAMAASGFNPFETTKKPASKATVATIVILSLAVLVVGGYVIWQYVLPNASI